MSILIVAEQRGGAWNRMSWETVAAAQQLGRELGQPVEAAVVGKGVTGLAGELGRKQLEKVYAVEHDLLDRPAVAAHSRRPPAGRIGGSRSSGSDHAPKWGDGARGTADAQDAAASLCRAAGLVQVRAATRRTRTCRPSWRLCAATGR